MNQVPPLRLTPDGAQLLANRELLRLSKELSEVYASKEKLVIDEFLQVIGAMLWNSLDAEEAMRQAKRNAGQGVLPVIIESDESAVHQLPWETLCHPEFGFIGRHEGFTLSRSIPSNGAWLPPVEAGPLRVLLFTSLPDDLDKDDQLQIEEEQAQVLEVLGPWRQSGHVVLEMPDDGRFSVFKTMLREFKPHLAWLSGHGAFRKNLHDGVGTGYFLFEGEDDGMGALVDEVALAEAFSGTAVQALILSACQSGKAVSTNLNNGLMFTLSAKGVPHVVAMRESIYDQAGIQFARAFFTALLVENGSLAVALQQGRSAIRRPFEHEERFRHSPLAGLSFGQWCLPALLSHEHSRPLIDWRFTPKAMREKNLLNESLNDITFPKRFIGRRRELRALQRSLRDGSIRALLVTGAGGMGKTALAGKLTRTLEQDGYEVFGFSAREGRDWKQSILQMELALDEPFSRKYSSINLKDDPAKQASLLLKLLLMQYGKKMALLFDNLESVQDPATRTLTDAELKAWIDAACALQQEGLRVVLTSRWLLPDWHFAEQSLGKPVWRDFLAVVQQMKLPQNILGNYVRLRRIFDVLGGNFRAVEFFAGAIRKMNSGEEEAFLETLDGVQEEIQADMALDKIWQYRSEDEREVLRRMTAYQVPVSLDGVGKIAQPELPVYEQALHELLSVSLVERYGNATRKAEEYLVAPLVRSWLEKQGIAKPEQELLQRAAAYHRWLLDNERRTVDQAMITHAALMAAEQHEDAHRIALDWIVGSMNMAGLYYSLLDNWLLPACSSSDQWILSEALNQTGKQYHHLADYDTALDYLKRSLKIRQEIGDKSGEGTTLNNISQIFKARGDYDTALDYLKRSLKIQQEIGDKSGEGTTLNNISQIFKARGDYDTALEYLKRSLKIIQEIGDKAHEAGSLNNISALYHARGDYDTALDYLKRSLKIQQEIGDKSGEGTTLNNIAGFYHARGDYDTALDYLKRSLKIQQEIGDKSGEGATLNNISALYHARGDYDTALGYLKRSLTISQEIGDKSGEGTTLGNIATNYHARGDYDTALDYLKRSLKIQQEIGDKSGEGATLNNISQIYDARGDYDTALDYLKRSLKIQQEIGDKSGEGTTLNNISALYHARGDYDTALDYLKRSLKIRQEIGDKSGEGTTLNNISQIFKARGDYDTALDYLKRSLKIRQEIGDKSGLCYTLFNMGHIHWQNDEQQDAVVAWFTVYRIAKAINLAEVLQALESLAAQLGLEGGLDGWEQLSRQMGENMGGTES
ncbi:MAG: tetratricopeptide repeat protein [Chlorobaculum sp.]|nr:tetratricopeptide repeat protein [Chlorobaculum sp.]